MSTENDLALARSFTFYVATLLFFGVGAITTLGLDWYGTLQLPWWTPPELFVAAVWFLLFLCTAFSVTRFWDESKRTGAAFKSILMVYMGNALLILLWNYVFFGLHHLAVSFWVAVAVGVSVLVLMVRLWKDSRAAAWLLAPYLAWMTFALGFTYQLLLIN